MSEEENTSVKLYELDLELDTSPMVTVKARTLDEAKRNAALSLIPHIKLSRVFKEFTEQDELPWDENEAYVWE